MGKHARRALLIALIIIGTIAAILVAAQALVNSRIATRLVDKYATEFIDGKLSYSRLNISFLRHFPKISVEIDSLGLTYPHDRFSAFDGRSAVKSSLLDIGRSEEADTLASFDRLGVEVNVWPLLSGRLRVNGVRLSGLRAFARKFGDDANWNIFKTSPKDTSVVDEPLSLPLISIGEVSVNGSPLVVYTDQVGKLFARATFEGLSLGGVFKIGGDLSELKFRRVSLSLSDFQASCRLPSDTVSLALPNLQVTNPDKRTLDLDMTGNALLGSSRFGSHRIPFCIGTRASYEPAEQGLDLSVPWLNASLACISLAASGDFQLRDGSVGVDATAKVDKLSLGSLLDDFAVKFVPSLSDISTNAVLDLDVKANGVLAEGKIPKIDAKVRIPSGNVSYKPLNVTAGVGVDATASISPTKYVRADVNRLALTTDGLDLKMDASGLDILGADPQLKANASGSVVIDSLLRYLPDSLDIKARGDLDLDIKADTRLSEIKTLRFKTSDIKGFLHSNSLQVAMPSDTLFAALDATEVNFVSAPSGLELAVGVDSLAMRKGDDLRARIRAMKNKATVNLVEVRDQKVVKLAAKSTGSGLFLKYGPHRVGMKTVDLTASAQKRPKFRNEKLEKYLDSLQTIYPGVRRDSLFAHSRSRGRRLPPYLSEKDFKKGDISVSVDSSLMKLWSEWKPYGRVELGTGFVATPMFPLRTRIGGISATFADNDVKLDSVVVKSGTSHIRASGDVKNLRSAIRGRGAMDINLDVRSKRLNANELLSAIAVGGKADTTSRSQREDDESFVIDTLSDKQAEMALFIVPGNIRGAVKIDADEVDYSDFIIKPLKAHASIKERCLQLSDASLKTNYGDIDAAAFYQTRTKKDIGAGVDLRLSNVDANGIIHIIPAIGKAVPMLESFKGNLGCEVSATTQLDTAMNINMSTLDGIFRISGKELRIDDAGDLKNITRLLLFKNKNIGDIADMSVDAVVHDNKLEIFPFILGVDRYRLALMGVQGFDKSMNYHVSILKSPLPFKFGINLFGSLDNWKFSIGKAKYQDGKTVPVFTEQLDSMQVNIGYAIKNIFRKGVSNAMKQSGQSVKALEVRKAALKYDASKSSEFLSGEEFAKLDAMNFENEIGEMNAEMQDDIDKILDDTFTNASQLMTEYEASQGKSKRRKQ